MMDKWTIMRGIPEKFRAGIEAGRYTVHGGVIRNASGTKSIIGHLIKADPSALETLGQAFAPLCKATLALNAMNLAVSVAGFAVIVKKLNVIDRKMDQVSEELGQLLTGQIKISWQLELERRSKLAANLKNLARGLRIGDTTMTSVALNALTESAEFYQKVSEELLQDIRQTYQDTETLRVCMEMALGASLAQAHALALRGHLDEAVRVIDELEQWRARRQEELDAPHKTKPAPLWLGQLSAKTRQACRNIVQWQREIPQGLAYTRDQYQLCIEADFSFEQLSQIAERERVATLVPIKRADRRKSKVSNKKK